MAIQDEDVLIERVDKMSKNYRKAKERPQVVGDNAF
tara:strand:- start:669 stop:776 length:108 start_codon:yes stop_codon:yes gene_type:complete